MNRALLKLLIDCTDENDNLDINRLKREYKGDLISDLRSLARVGYISYLDSDDGDDVGEIVINPSGYHLFK